MCGIAGIWSPSSNIDLSKTIKEMTDSLIHRGPDDQGQWMDDSIHVGFGHRRLSIFDLTPMGHQPMFSHSERWVVVLNGEIYNFQEIKKEILEMSALRGKAIKFKGTSDTEVLVEAVDLFGVDAAVKKFVGMFAIALFDKKENELYLIRDRMGEKPLYYGLVNQNFVFASELKALYKVPQFCNEIHKDALGLYFRHNYIPAPYTIYQGIFKLIPGTILRVSNIRSEIPTPYPYWSILDIVKNEEYIDHFSQPNARVLNEMERLLSESIAKQMVADVPVGAFLSGGIDSSLVVALMQSHSKTPVNTFSIGFHEKRYNEAEDAQKVAKHLKTNHTEMYVSSKDAMDVIPILPQIYDEPFSDSSQIPTYLVSKIAKGKVTVSLSGDGGDELFCGYDRYLIANNIWCKMKKMPLPVRHALAGVALAMPPGAVNQSWDMLNGILPPKYRYRALGDKLHKLANMIKFDDVQSMYRHLISHLGEPEQLVLNSDEPETILSNRHMQNLFKDNMSMMMGLDLLSYLPDDILVKVDRAAMSVGLETRVPLLDHRIVEYALAMPTALKIKDGKTKWPLRQVLYQYVPAELIERPKKGFAVPVGEWIRSDLREWAELLLDEKSLKEQGFLNSNLVRKMWKEHLEGKRNWQDNLWNILMFQTWMCEYKNARR